MQRLGRRETSFIILLSVFMFCWGCAAPATAPKSPVVAAQQEAQQPGQVQKPANAPAQAKAGRVQNIRVQEGKGEMLVVFTGDAPFVNYEIQRLSEDQFLLQLQDIGSPGDLPTSPPVGDKLNLAYALMESGRGVEVIGTIKGHLDRYTMCASGNDLVVALVIGEAPQTRPATSASSSTAAPVAAQPKTSKKVIPASAVAAPARPAQPPPLEPVRTGAALSAPGQMPFRGEGNLSAATGAPSLKQYTGKPISLDLVDADLRNVLRLISDVTGTNIVIEPDAGGRVTLRVEQIPWDQVLDMVLSMNNLGMEKHGNVIRIARMEKLRQETTVKTDEIKAKQDLSEAYRDTGDIVTVYFPVNYALPSDIAKRVEDLKSDRGKITVDDKTRVIIYTDFLSRIENARILVGKLDKQTSQVLIEARIVTMTTSLSRTIGTSFSLGISHVNSTNSATPFTQSWTVNSPATNFFGFALAQIFGKTLVELDLTLAAYESTSDLNIVAAPKVVTLDNVKATITQGTQIPYLQINETGTTTGTQFVNAVVELQVVPHITPDGKVRMEIQAKQDEPTSETYTINEQPGIETRKISTELMVDDGNIVMIGGVLRNRDSAAERRTPGLARIPIIGSLFKMDSTTKEKTELVIFISPKIVESTKAM